MNERQKSVPDTPGYMPTFCLHFVLPTVLLFVVALVTGNFGGEYGIPYLVWHDDVTKQFWVGFGLAILVWQCLLVGFLLWAKKAGRPERFRQNPALVDWISPKRFASYSGWILGQFLAIGIIVGLLVLLVQVIDAVSHGDQPNLAVAPIEDANSVLPPPLNYTWWLPLGALMATAFIFLGGFITKLIVLWRAHSNHQTFLDRAIQWVRNAATYPTTAPRELKGSLINALWQAGSQEELRGKIWAGILGHMVFLGLGVVFIAIWELTNLSFSASLVAGIVGVSLLTRARWLSHPRVFQIFLFLLACLTYFVLNWLGTRPWCGWPVSFVLLISCLICLPIGIRYAFPGPTAAWLNVLSNRLIAKELRDRYPFHVVTVILFLFGGLVLFGFPSWFESVRSPVILVTFLIFMGVALYAVFAYLIDDALPFVVPAMAICIILSGLPQYKMKLPGLAYEGVDAKGRNHLLDLEAVTWEDLQRQQKFDEAVNKDLQNPAVFVGLNDSGPVREVDRLWATIENENRILPGKDLRPYKRATSLETQQLMMLNQIPFKEVGPTLKELQAPASTKPEKKPMVIVVASGGGVRSAAWTFLVLGELERRFAAEGIPFPYHIRMITGASGGMFGGAYYVRSLKNPKEMDWGSDRTAEMVNRYELLTQDWLTPIVERMITNDIPSFFSPFATPTDRGIALEEEWSKKLFVEKNGVRTGELDMTFSQLAQQEREGWCPSLVFSPMMVEGGRRLIISNMDMRYPASNDGHLLDSIERPAALVDQNRNFSHEAFELFRMFPHAQERFSIATAVRLSASFPYFSPAVSLPTIPRRRVVDAGYYDNYGVSLAASYLFSKKNMQWFDENVSKIVVLQIRDGQSDDERRLHAVPDGLTRQKGLGNLLSRSLEELTSPIEGLNTGRVGTCSFRNDGLLELLSTFFEKQKNEPPSGKLAHKHRYFTVVNFEFPGRAALSWYLSKGEKEQIRQSFSSSYQSADLNGRIDALMEWWKAPTFEEMEIQKNKQLPGVTLQRP
ncbi:MAG: hypothetical protein R3B84_09350 [Zavarzinella sp.]